MTLSKKHFIRIADIIKENKNSITDLNGVVNSFCLYFENENSNFNKSKFIEYINQ